MRIKVYNKSLCTDLWDENQNLKPEVYQSLLKVATDFYKSTDLISEPEDILMLGSIVGYNWNPKSDIDIHVLIDIEKEKIDSEIARKFLDVLAYKWNTEHEVEIKDHKVEVYLQDIHEQNHSIGVYSIMENRWIRKPCPQRVVLDKEKIQKKFSSIRNQISEFIRSKDVEQLKGLMKAIRNYRQAGLDRTGEFSTENVVFKALRHSGELGRLKDAINSVYDRQVSIDEKVKDHSFLYADIDESFNIKASKFLWIGYTTQDFKVKMVNSSKLNTDNPTHSDAFPWIYDERGDDVFPWRFRSDLGMLFWWVDENRLPNSTIKDDTEFYILKVLNYTGKIEHKKITTGGHDYESSFLRAMAHDADISSPEDYKLTEVKGVPNIWIGYTDEETLETNAIKTLGGSNHPDIPGYSMGTGKKRWRWREDINFVFWWTRPTEEEQESATMWLEDHAGVKIHRHYSTQDFGYSSGEFDDIESVVHNPYEPLGKVGGYKRKLKESKFDPFEAKELEFVTYGGINPTKQKGFGGEKSFHIPPTRRGFYAFVWPYIDKFLLGGSSLVDPKARGKGTRNRLTFVRDKEGNVITSDHPDFEKLSNVNKNWSLTRTKDNKPKVGEKPVNVDWDDYYKSILYRPSARKKFKYNGPVWHHLKSYIKPHEVIDERGDWIKTSMDSFKNAFKKELIKLRYDSSRMGMPGVKLFSLDHLEVFIDQKV